MMMEQGSTIVRVYNCPDNPPLLVIAKTPSNHLFVVNQSLLEVRCVHDWAFKEVKKATPESKAYSEHVLTLKYVQQRILKWMFGSQINITNSAVIDDPYCTVEMEMMRTTPGASVCTDEECSLSGGYAHIGPCEPCKCGMEHAIDECPNTY
jgi:hypothetical protein